MTFPNRYAGECAACRSRVPAQKGFAFRNGSGWRVCCASAACGRQLGVLRESAGVAAAATTRELRADGTVAMPFDRDALPLLRAMPGARWNGDRKVWSVSLDAGDRSRVLELAERLGLSVAPELRADATPATAAPLLERAAKAGLYPYQLDGVRFLAQKRRALLGDDMGLGKTVQVLLALPEHARAIVVCPASLKFNWRDECARWRPDLAPVVLAGRGSFRLPKPGELVIVNFDVLPAPPAKGEPSPWDLSGCVLVVDEATAVKSYKAKRSKSVQSLGATADKVWLLSGTPLMNRPLDLFGLLSSGHMAGEVFGGWKGFVRCFQGHKNRWGGWEFGDPLPEAPERLRRVMLRRHKSEVLSDLPAATYRDVAVNAVGELVRELDTALRDWADDEGYVGDIAHFVPDALPPFERFSAIRAKLAASRVGAMLELVEQHEDAGEALLVFSAHRAPIDTLASRDGWAVITGDTAPDERQAIVRRFQAGELRGVGLTIKAGGMGLTLTRAHHVLFVDLDWTPAWNVQAVDRVRRIGQKASHVLVTRLVSEHPLDKHVHALLAQKMRLIELAVEATVAYTPSAAPESGWREESDEELAARLAALEAAAQKAERDATLSWVERKASDLQARGGAKAPPITPELGEALRGAWGWMLSRCDGALTEDGVGFNKPDAAVAHKAMPVLDDERALALAWLVLRKYRGQCEDLFPALYPQEAA